MALRMIILTLACIVLLPLISCFTFKKESNLNHDVRTNEFFCHFKEGLTYTRVTLAATYKNTLECYKCKCDSEYYSSCFGIGYNAGSIGAPNGCKLKKLPNCEYVFVKNDDDNQTC